MKKLLWIVAFTLGLNASAQEKPKVYLVADAHLDTQWNWDIQTTIKEYVWNTLYQNLFLLKKYPEYVFNFEGGVKYAWMKEYYPREYDEMKRFIREGRWHISGASWDATDNIVPSPESAIRNILLGQEFYRHEFGVESTDIFLPDCFGFGYTLPTVAHHCGLLGFSSQKLGWRHHDFHGQGKRYPYPVGLWQGIDGARIMMAHGYSYGHRWAQGDDLTRSTQLQNRLKETSLGTLFHYYGTGDVGGSPTLSSVDAVAHSTHADGPLRIVSAASDQMFKDYLPYDQHPELPIYTGELLMDVHGTGCYTSQAAMKLYNRQNEQLGDAAERAAVAASVLGVQPYPGQRLTEGWRRFLFHQFHDDLTGTSIPRAYEFSWNDELLTLKQFSSVLTRSVEAVSRKLDTRVKGTPVVLYNALGHAATDVIELSIPATSQPKSASVLNAEGKAVPAQVVGYADGRARVLAEVSVPACGFAVYSVRLSGKGTAEQSVATQSVENSRYALSLDTNGDIVSLTDKQQGRQLVQQGQRIRLALFDQNESFDWPAWEILKKTLDAPSRSFGAERASMALVEDGPLRKTLRVEKTDGDSRFVQYIRLYEGALSERIDFYNEVDWQSTNKLLKAEFPLAVSNDEATYDLGIGAVRRGNNTDRAYEVYAHQWADLTDCGDDYGVTVLNDCKYGWDKPDDHTLRLTLLHTPMTRRGYAYQDHQDFGHHTFTYSFIGHAGPLHKATAVRQGEVLNQPIKAFTTDPHAGTLGKTYSLVESDNPNISIKAVKVGESTSDVVLRIYETSGNGPQEARLTFAAPIGGARQADGTEQGTGRARYEGNTLYARVGQNGVATYRVALQAETLSLPKSQPLPLPYNAKCFSWNEMRGDADFESGYSYAAELVPECLTAGDVEFRLENKELLNGLRCDGDTLQLPAGYNRLYVLAAAATADKSVTGTFVAGKTQQTLTVPSYTGFVGQWGHTGHTQGYLLPDEVTFVGTHRHSPAGDHAYEFTYMYQYAIDLPKGATQVVLPKAPQLVIFAATLAQHEGTDAQPLTTLYRTSNVGTAAGAVDEPVERTNLLSADKLCGYSNYINDRERPEFVCDGDAETKWCDVAGVPSYVEFDLGEPTDIAAWKVVSAGGEHASYVTGGALLQVRDAKTEEWRTADLFMSNQKNVVNRTLARKERARYVRLLVVHPEQGPDAVATRIYEFAVYGQ